MSEWQVINDDFRNHLYLFDNSVYVISDPPYNQKYHYDQYKDNLDIDDYGELLRLAFGDTKSVVIHYPEETVNILARVLEGCEQSVAWIYNSNTAKQHRQITWWGCKPDMRKLGQPYKNPTDKRVKRLMAMGKQARLYDWWDINQVKNVSKTHNHPCPIPYELAERLVLLTTDEGDTIVDPFMGIGTIGLASIKNNRNFIGMELSKDYCDEAEKLFKDFENFEKGKKDE